MKKLLLLLLLSTPGLLFVACEETEDPVSSKGDGNTAQYRSAGSDDRIFSLNQDTVEYSIQTVRVAMMSVAQNDDVADAIHDWFIANRSNSTFDWFVTLSEIDSILQDNGFDLKDEVESGLQNLSSGEFPTGRSMDNVKNHFNTIMDEMTIYNGTSDSLTFEYGLWIPLYDSVANSSAPSLSDAKTTLVIENAFWRTDSVVKASLEAGTWSEGHFTETDSTTMMTTFHWTIDIDPNHYEGVDERPLGGCNCVWMSDGCSYCDNSDAGVIGCGTIWGCTGACPCLEDLDQ